MLVFAHRGAPKKGRAENTLETLQLAASSGVDGIEFDVRTTRDGQLIVFHDEDLRRLAGDVRRPEELTADELSELVLRSEGTIPRLQDVTSSVPAPVQLDIEIKGAEAVEGVILKLQTSAGLRERSIVSSFRLVDLERVKKVLPDVRTLFLFPSWPLPLRRNGFWKRVSEAGVWGVGTRGIFLNRRRVAWLRKKGWAVAAWDDQPLRRLSRQIGRLEPDVAIVFCPDECRQTAVRIA